MKLTAAGCPVLYLTILGSAAAVLGCGGGTSAPTYRPGVDFDAGADAADHVEALDLGGPATDAAVAPPMTGAGARRILSGAASLIGNGFPCTNEEGSTGDMWCALLKASTILTGSQALYVVNVSQALAGTPVVCGSPAGDPNCLMLTSGFAEDDTHKAAFQGRTLVYYDQTATPYGWRPGMVNGRRLVVVTSETGDAHDCTAAPRGDAVVCLQDVAAPTLLGQSISTTAQFSDLLVGRVGEGSPVLRKVETVISNDTNDDLERFQLRFVGAAGDRIAWSTRVRPGTPEVLKTQTVDDDASRIVVATDVSRWAASPDGTTWGWLSAFNYNSQAPSGMLEVASFPDGAAPVAVLPSTATFSFVTGHKMAVLNVAGELFGVPEPGVGELDTLSPLDSNVLGVIAVSTLGDLAYVKKFDFIFRLVDLYVQRLDGSSHCNLDRNEEVPFGGSLGPRFLPSGAGMVWARLTNLDTTDDRLIASGKFTRLADCSTQTVEPDLVALGPLGGDGLSISDSYDGQSGTLRIRDLTAGGDMLAPGEATVVQTRMNSSLSLYPFLRALLYTVNIGDPADGLYLRPVGGAVL